jgi:hypothetical protein
LFHSKHTTADGLLEGPTAVFCEKGGRAMANHSDSPLREEVQRYLTGCEYLLAAAPIPPPFSDEELSLIRFYLAEVGKIPSVSANT